MGKNKNAGLWLIGVFLVMSLLFVGLKSCSGQSEHHEHSSPVDHVTNPEQSGEIEQGGKNGDPDKSDHSDNLGNPGESDHSGDSDDPSHSDNSGQAGKIGQSAGKALKETGKTLGEFSDGLLGEFGTSNEEVSQKTKEKLNKTGEYLNNLLNKKDR